MAGHSQFKNIMHRKGAQDARRSRQYAKLAREIAIAARSGVPDPGMNARLRTAIANARAANMSREAIERAIKRASGSADGPGFAEVRYEGFGPGGVAIIVDTLTDNRNRTGPDVRGAFVKHGGALGDSGSVAYLFRRVGSIAYAPEAASAEDMLDGGIEAGADDVQSTAQGHTVTCAPDALNEVREALERRFGPPESARLAWQPQVSVPVEGEAAEGLLKLLQALEDNDDVQDVSANYEISEKLLERLNP